MYGYTCRDTYFNYGSYLRSRGYDKEICNLVTAIENGSINLGSVQPDGTENGATINGTLTITNTDSSKGQLFVKGGDSGNPYGDAVIPSELGSQLYHGAHVIGPIYQSSNVSNVKPSATSTQGYKRTNVFNSHEHIFRAPLDISDTIVRIQGDLIVDGSFVMVADEEAESLTLSAGSTHNREMLDIFHGARQASGLDIMDIWLDSSQNVAIADAAAPPAAYESLLAFAIDGDLSGTIIGNNGSTGVHGRTRMLRGATITSVPEATGLDISYSVLPAVINNLALDLYGGVRMQAGPTDPSGNVSEPHLSVRGANARFSIGPSLLQTNAYITADGSGIFQDMSAVTAEIGELNLSTLSVNTLDASNIDASGITIIGDSSFNGAVYASGVVTAQFGYVGDLTGNVSGNVTGNVDGIVGGTTPAAVTGTTITANTGFTGDLTGDVIGDLSSNITNFIDLSGNDISCNHIVTQTLSTLNGGLLSTDDVTIIGGDLAIGGYPGPTARFSVAHASGDVSLNGTLTVNNYISGSNDLYISGDISGSGDVYFNGLSTPALQNGNAVYIKQNGQVYEQTSSRRFKTNIESINNDTATNLSTLNPVTFNYTGSDVLSYGLIAEEVAETSFSSIVTKDANGDPKGIDYSQLISPIIALVKQQNDKIQSLEERILALETSE
jgi:hypothetical protein